MFWEILEGLLPLSALAQELPVPFSQDLDGIIELVLNQLPMF